MPYLLPLSGNQLSYSVEYEIYRFLLKLNNDMLTAPPLGTLADMEQGRSPQRNSGQVFHRDAYISP